MTPDKPLTLIIFENDWCAQCYTQRPIINSIQQKFASELDVKMINVERNAALADKYQIYSAPSLILLKRGQVVEKITRFIEKQPLATVINYYL